MFLVPGAAGQFIPRVCDHFHSSFLAPVCMSFLNAGVISLLFDHCYGIKSCQRITERKHMLTESVVSSALKEDKKKAAVFAKIFDFGLFLKKKQHSNPR